MYQGWRQSKDPNKGPVSVEGEPESNAAVASGDLAQLPDQPPDSQDLCHVSLGQGLLPGDKSRARSNRQTSMETPAWHKYAGSPGKAGGGSFLSCHPRLTPSLLGVNAGEGQVLPQHLQQVVQVQLHTATAGKAVSGRPALGLRGQVSIVGEY